MTHKGSVPSQPGFKTSFEQLQYDTEINKTVNTVISFATVPASIMLMQILLYVDLHGCIYVCLVNLTR